MTPNASTVATVHDAAIPAQRTPNWRRLKATQPALFALIRGQYCPPMGDTTGPWGDYIRHAADRVGGVRALADRTGLNRNTLFRWKRGDNAETPQISHIFAIADAAAGPNATNAQWRAERRRAVLAAGQITDDVGSGQAGEPAREERAADHVSERADRRAVGWPAMSLPEVMAYMNDLADQLRIYGPERVRMIAEVARAFERADEAAPGSRAPGDGEERTRDTA